MRMVGLEVQSLSRWVVVPGYVKVTVDKNRHSVHNLSASAVRRSTKYSAHCCHHFFLYEAGTTEKHNLKIILFT